MTNVATYPPPAAADRVRRLKVWTPDELGAGGTYEVAIPPWGYLEGVEMRLRELLPNMDASVPNRLRLGILDGWNGPPAPMDVVALVRDVLEPGAGADPYREAPRPGEVTLPCPSCGEQLRGLLELIRWPA